MVLVDLEEWIWDCYPIQIRHGGLKPTIRMMYTGDPSPTIRRVSLNMDVPQAILMDTIINPVEWGVPIFTPSWKLLRRLSCVDTDRPNINLDFWRWGVRIICKLWKPYGNHMETIWKPYGNHMETIWKPCSFHCPTGPNISNHINPQCCLPAISQSPGWQRWGSCCCGLFGFLRHGRWSEIGRLLWDVVGDKTARWGFGSTALYANGLRLRRCIFCAWWWT